MAEIGKTNPPSVSDGEVIDSPNLSNSTINDELVPPSNMTAPGVTGQAAPPGGTQKVSDIIGNLRPARQFKFTKPNTLVTSLSFDDSGELLLAAASDESLQIYNVREGRLDKTLFSKKYGCHLARFTHHSQSIIYASTKADDTIRYLSTHDNQYLRYFKGHTAPVTSLAVCPGSDSFISCSLDNTVRLWDLASPHVQGRLDLATPTLSAYDPAACVIAIASPSTSSVLLYDLRNFDKPPFATFDLKSLDNQPHVKMHGAQHPRDWTRIEFSNDGQFLLVCTNDSIGHIMLDAFTGGLKAFLVRPPSNLPLNPMHQRPAPYPPAPHTGGIPLGQGDACFTPDARYVIGASGGEKDAVVWDAQGHPDEHLVLKPLASLPCKTRASVVEYNPRFNLLATADKEVILWVPDDHVDMKPA